MKKIIIIFIFLLILIGLFIRNYHYQQVLFFDWDEGMYGQIAREIIKNKTIITTFNNQVWLDKPPLSHFLIAFTFFIFGESEFYSRLMMVVLSFVLLILLFFLTKKLFKNNFASIINVLILASSPIFLERAIILNSDLLVAIGWLGYFLFWENYWLKLLFLTIGVWSKSVLGFYPLVFEIIVFLIKFKGIQSQINWKNTLKFLSFIIVPSSWYIFSLIIFGQKFINDHFSNQIFKRVYVPIELHFGNKFFYFNYLWNKLNFINIFFILGYWFFLINWKKEIKNIKKVSIFLSPLFFIGLLTLVKTKIDWYVIIFLPLLILSVSYLYANSKPFLIRGIISISVMVYFFIYFLPNTFFVNVNYQKPEKLDLALCLNRKQIKNLAFLVDEQERRNKQFLEASHYYTNSSFYYGGSPSFVYYLNKPINFFYDPEDFKIKYQQFSTIALSKKDFQLLINEIDLNKVKKPLCQTENWLSFTIK